MTSILKSAPAERYRTSAKRFVATVDGRASYPPAEWLARVHGLLPELYAAALVLDEVEPDTADGTLPSMSYDDWKRVYDDIAGALGRWNYYWDVYDPYDESDREAVCGSVADDLADIYRDVWEGLRSIDSDGDARPNDVMWGWRFAFESHWAAHATGALRALSTAFFVHHAAALPESFGREASVDPPAS